MKKRNNKRPKQWLFTSLILLFIFQPFLQKAFPIFSYFDECLGVLAMAYCAVSALIRRKNNIKSSEKDKKLSIALVATFIIGVISNLNSSLQEIQYILGDIIIFYKFFSIYFLYKTAFSDVKMPKNILRVIIILLFCGTIFDYIFNTNLTDYYRFGLKSNYLIFGNPLGLLSVSSFVLCAYIMSHKKIDLYVFLNCIVILSTMRYKAFVFLVLFWIFYYFIVIRRKKIKLNKIVILAVISLIVAYGQIEFYFIKSSDTTARGQLFYKSLQIANDNMPFGTGFATYGSYMSGVSYSNLYYEYKLNGVYGLNKDYSVYLSDSFWPMIIAQFGYLGLICFIFVVKKLFDNIQESFNDGDKHIYLAKILALSYLLISSMAESAFVNPVCMPFAIVLSLRSRKEQGEKG